MSRTRHVPGQGWRYTTVEDLRADAQQAADWYATTGMKPATETTGIPRDVAAWLLLRLPAPTDTL